MSEEEVDKICGGKSDNPHWDKPSVPGMNIKFLLHQNQIWVNRRSILLYLDREIEIIRKNHIDNINEYWDYSKIQYLEGLRTMFASLSPDEAKEQIG